MYACFLLASSSVVRGGAIGWADTESTGSTAAQSQAAEGPSPGVGSASAPANKVANPLRTTLQATVQGVTSTLSSIRKLGQQHSAAPGPTTTEPAATNNEGDNEALVPPPRLIQPGRTGAEGGRLR